MHEQSALVIMRYSTTFNCVISEARYIECVPVFAARGDLSIIYFINGHVASTQECNRGPLLAFHFGITRVPNASLWFLRLLNFINATVC